MIRPASTSGQRVPLQQVDLGWRVGGPVDVGPHSPLEHLREPRQPDPIRNGRVHPYQFFDQRMQSHPLMSPVVHGERMPGDRANRLRHQLSIGQQHAHLVGDVGIGDRRQQGPVDLPGLELRDEPQQPPRRRSDLRQPLHRKGEDRLERRRARPFPQCRQILLARQTGLAQIYCCLLDGERHVGQHLGDPVGILLPQRRRPSPQQSDTLRTTERAYSIARSVVVVTPRGDDHMPAFHGGQGGHQRVGILDVVEHQQPSPSG